MRAYCRCDRDLIKKKKKETALTHHSRGQFLYEERGKRGKIAFRRDIIGVGAGGGAVIGGTHLPQG